MVLIRTRYEQYEYSCSLPGTAVVVDILLYFDLYTREADCRTSSGCLRLVCVSLEFQFQMLECSSWFASYVRARTRRFWYSSSTCIAERQFGIHGPKPRNSTGFHQDEGQGWHDKSRPTRERKTHARMAHLASSRRGTHGAASPTKIRPPIEPAMAMGKCRAMTRPKRSRATSHGKRQASIERKTGEGGEHRTPQGSRNKIDLQKPLHSNCK